MEPWRALAATSSEAVVPSPSGGGDSRRAQRGAAPGPYCSALSSPALSLMPSGVGRSLLNMQPPRSTTPFHDCPKKSAPPTRTERKDPGAPPPAAPNGRSSLSQRRSSPVPRNSSPTRPPVKRTRTAPNSGCAPSRVPIQRLSVDLRAASARTASAPNTAYSVDPKTSIRLPAHLPSEAASFLLPDQG